MEVYGWIFILPPYSIALLTMWGKHIHQVKPIAFNDKMTCSFYAVSHCLVLLTPCRALGPSPHHAICNGPWSWLLFKTSLFNGALYLSFFASGACGSSSSPGAVRSPD